MVPGLLPRYRHPSGALVNLDGPSEWLTAGGATRFVGRSALVKSGLSLGQHVLERMARRDITTKMISLALRKGEVFWDPKNKALSYILRGVCSGGKDLLVGQNPVTGKVTTAIIGRNLIKKRLMRLP